MNVKCYIAFIVSIYNYHHWANHLSHLKINQDIFKLYHFILYLSRAKWKCPAINLELLIVKCGEIKMLKSGSFKYC